jgi:hypothetical protein
VRLSCYVNIGGFLLLQLRCRTGCTPITLRATSIKNKNQREQQNSTNKIQGKG